MLQLQRTIGNQAVQRQPAPAAPPPPQPLMYNRDRRGGRLLDRGTTKDEITRQLTEKVRAGDLSRFEVKVPGTGPAEIFLLAEILASAKRSNWGTESDFVIAIGWPKEDGGLVPRGQVTLRITPQGAATAELIAEGTVPASTQTTFAAGPAKLMADFGFESVTGWVDTPKSVGELGDVLAALELLKARSPQDVAALKGVQLIRVPSLGGTTAGEFSVAGGWLKLADLAFSANDVQFFGGGKPSSPSVPASFHPILHEVGHAVEKEDLRLAKLSLAKAEAGAAAARKVIEDESATYDAEFDKVKNSPKKLNAFWEARKKSHKANEKAEATANALHNAEIEKFTNTMVTDATVQSLKSQAASASTAAANSLKAAKTGLQALRPDEVQSSAAYVKAIEDAAAAIISFAADAQAGRKPVDELEKDVFSKVADRSKAQPARTHKAVPLLDPLVQAQDAWFEEERALARARLRTRRLQKFIDLVTANNIQRFTKYSVDNWKLIPDEFYAEAYSLWLVDPEFVKINYKAVYDFFQNGDHRK